MKFNALVVENFLAINRARVELMDRGLVSIEGVNEDDSSAVSNGAGKSSIADALCWCIYGVTARGVSGDAIVNNKTRKNTFVSISVHDDDSVYYIRRYRKHKEHKNALHLLVSNPPGSGFSANLTQGTDKLTQELVEKIIGCSYDVFRSSIYAGQEQMPDLPGMTDKQLKLLVEEAAGVTVLEAAYVEARARLQEKSKISAERSAQLGSNKERIAEVYDDLQTAKRAKSGFKKEQKAQAQTLIEHIAVVKKHNVEIDAKIAEANEDNIRRKIKVIDDRLKALDNERQEERRLDEHSQTTFATCRSLTGASSVIKNQIESAQYDFDRVNERIGTPCGECGKTYCEDDLAEAKKLAKRKIADLNAQLDALKTQHATALETHKSAFRALEEFRASMTDVAKLSAARTCFSENLASVNMLKVSKEHNLKRIDELKQQARSILDAKDPNDERVKTLEDRFNAINEAINKGALEAKQAEDDLNVYTMLAKVFSPAGVRAHILDTVTPFLNGQTAKYLSVLSDGNIEAVWTTLVPTAKGELREKFSIEVNNSKGGSSFGLISGGEKRKVRIACALALQDLVASRATKPIELFIGDEIDDALDAAGLERLMIILQEKARERGSVFVISHNSGIRDWIPDNITIVRKDGASTIMEAA
jgi:DNA repair exonuclease SbcCD ATPase subunit